MKQDMTYRTQVYRSIHDIKETEWDALLDEQTMMQSYRFLTVVEDAHVEEAHFWYLMIYHQDQLVAHAALSSMTVALEMFMEGKIEHWVKKIRSWWPAFLKIKILFCGLPVSMCQSNVKIKDGYHSTVLPLITREMEGISMRQKIRFLCWKEFKEGGVQLFQPLTRQGFFRAASLPNMKLDIPWSNFEAYLSSLRHPYRRSIKLSMQKLQWEKPVIYTSPANHFPPDQPRLQLGGADICSPQAFFQLYQKVIGRVSTKLEVLNQDFFELLFDRMNADIRILAFRSDTEIHSVALLTPQENTLTFLYVGMDDPRDSPFDPYFNLLYGILSYAIYHGFERVNMGQTAYWVKQRMGGLPEEVFLFFKARNPVLHAVLKLGKSVLFPIIRFRKIRVFNAKMQKHPVP